MLLSKLVEKILVLDRVGPTDVEISQINFDSRKVERGDVFVAVRGTQVDGHAYIPKAIELGAVAVVCEHLPASLRPGVSYVMTSDAGQALGLLAHAFYGQPSAKLKLVGVTGTNGKTTTATLLYRLFETLGHPSGLLSTIRNYIRHEVVPSTHTTGDALQIASLMARMVEAGCTHAFMEVTSHAIHQNRIAGLVFDGAIFTNLTHDHLDYHGTMEAYGDVKKSFFDDLSANSFALTNLDDPAGAGMLSGTSARRLTYGTSAAAEYLLTVKHSDSRGLSLEIDGHSLKSKLVGLFNAYNVAAAYSAAVLLGEEPGDVVVALEGIPPVEGRMESVASVSDVTVVVDFAHSPDALEKALANLRALQGEKIRLVCIVGCGGDRDREKRPVMAAIAAKHSDEVVLTSDNPRSEDPIGILDEMMAGLKSNDLERVSVVADRREAIESVCARAPTGAVILIAGKGHEKYQEIEGVRHRFDDVEVARSALERREASRSVTTAEQRQ